MILCPINFHENITEKAMIFQYLKSTYNKIKTALSKVRSAFSNKIKALFQKEIDEHMLEELEQLLFEADFGLKTASELTEIIRKLHKQNPSFTTQDYIEALKTHLLSTLEKHPADLKEVSSQELPLVILIVGVNGNGKTTTTAKLAHLFKSDEKKVLIAAADTFRAAAIDQLQTWAERIQVDIVKGKQNSDPAAVTFDAIQAAKNRHCDVLLIDTAGRLHTKIPLMQELEKIKRSCQKAGTQGPHETLLVLDATTGQNAIDQAKQFHKYVPLSGIVLTKLDGTAKGGIVFSIVRELNLPIKFVGTGEHIEDLSPFDPDAFVSGIFE